MEEYCFDKNERHVLIVFPHPDDESYCVAGTILAYAQRNVPLTYACLTLGEMGRAMGNPPLQHVNHYML